MPIIKRSPEKIETVLQMVANGDTVTYAAKTIGVSRERWYAWCDQDQALGKRFAKAREMGLAAIVEGVQDIAEGRDRKEVLAEDLPPHVVSKKIRELALLGDPVARDKLRIETRLKYAAIIDPSRYGAKSTVEHKGLPEGVADPRAVVKQFAAALADARERGITLPDTLSLPAPEEAEYTEISNGEEFI